MDAKSINLYRYEEELNDNGITLIAGVDEVGRGPLAGPVVVAAVILPECLRIKGINDSKQLSEKKRLELYEEIYEKALAIEVFFLGPEEIDNLNIYQATKLAMLNCINNLGIKPEHVLIDAMPLNELEIPHTSIIHGDALSASIAAASIVAKVERDAYMVKMSKIYPGYGFENHKGYSTKEHIEALERLGVTPIHRKTFGPVQKCLVKQLSLDI